MPKDTQRIVATMVDGSRFEGDFSIHGHERAVDTLNHIETFFHLRDVKAQDGAELPLVVLNKVQVVSIRHTAPPEDEIRGTLVLRKKNEPRKVFGKT